MNQSWASYKLWVADATNKGKKYYYRGQSDSDWTLKTTYHRNVEGSSMDMNKYLTTVMHDVNYHTSAFSSPIDLYNNIEFGTLLGKLQHHGFPTPLLDWTLSPYVASYFAFKNTPLQSPKNVSIFIFDIEAWTKQFGSKTDLLQPDPFVSDFVPYATGNPRMLRQMGVTTSVNTADIEHFILQKGKECSQEFLWRYDIPAYHRNEVMRELNSMGINDMTLFPDFDGLCQHLKEVHFTRNTIVLPPPPPPVALKA